MNPKSQKKALSLFNSIEKNTKKLSKNTKIVICPPFIYLPIFHSRASSITRTDLVMFKLGAQNCSLEKSGAFTGQVSVEMLKNIGCKYVIIGHSEAREYLNETNEIINKKLKAVLKAKLIPIFCVGDKSLRSKKDNKEIQTQLKKGLKDISNSKIKNIIFVYEPVWAISSKNGMAATPASAIQGKLLIEKVLNKQLGKNISNKVLILYGGSANSKNAGQYIKAGFNGLLVGKASLNSKEFIKIIKG